MQCAPIVNSTPQNASVAQNILQIKPLKTIWNCALIRLCIIGLKLEAGTMPHASSGKRIFKSRSALFLEEAVPASTLSSILDVGNLYILKSLYSASNALQTVVVVRKISSLVSSVCLSRKLSFRKVEFSSFKANLCLKKSGFFSRKFSSLDQKSSCQLYF